jgi:hypothetical protein
MKQETNGKQQILRRTRLLFETGLRSSSLEYLFIPRKVPLLQYNYPELSWKAKMRMKTLFRTESEPFNYPTRYWFIHAKLAVFLLLQRLQTLPRAQPQAFLLRRKIAEVLRWFVEEVWHNKRED